MLLNKDRVTELLARESLTPSYTSTENVTYSSGCYHRDPPRTAILRGSACQGSDIVHIASTSL